MKTHYLLVVIFVVVEYIELNITKKKEYGPKHDSTAIMIGLNLVDTTRDGWYGVPMSDISPKKNTVRLFLLMK